MTDERFQFRDVPRPIGASEIDICFCRAGIRMIIGEANGDREVIRCQLGLGGPIDREGQMGRDQADIRRRTAWWITTNLRRDASRSIQIENAKWRIFDHIGQPIATGVSTDRIPRPVVGIPVP